MRVLCKGKVMEALNCKTVKSMTFMKYQLITSQVLRKCLCYFSQVLKDPSASKDVLKSRAKALKKLGTIFQVSV